MGVVSLPTLPWIDEKATAGLVPDGRQLVHVSRQISADFRKTYRKPIPTKVFPTPLARGPLAILLTKDLVRATWLVRSPTYALCLLSTIWSDLHCWWSR